MAEERDEEGRRDCHRRRAGSKLDGKQVASSRDGAVVIAAITTCTNTSNPA